MERRSVFSVVVQLLLLTTFSYCDLDCDPDCPRKLWAVLVAGSNEYYNYRHQADICHSYQILHSHGIPDEQIIMFFYDDIAFNEENPIQGNIINRPNGTNVYTGVPKDYTGAHVTPKNFLNVLLGKSAEMEGIGSGKVLKSGPNDHVFVYFADHGAPGLLAFPNDELYATPFLTTLQAMKTKRMFKNMVIYVEACESGSMFAKKLPTNISIYAVTAANSKESSYACYYDDLRQTYLGDVFSVNWMEDSDDEDIESETLEKQFEIVKTETNTSHVQHFGNLTIAKMIVGQFQGLEQAPRGSNEKLPYVPYDAVPAPDVPLNILNHKLKKEAANSEESLHTQIKLYKLNANRQFLSDKMVEIVKKSVILEELYEAVMNERLELQDNECYENVVKHFSKNCFSLSKNDYALRQLYVFVNMCEMKIKPRAMRKAMDIVCTFPPTYGIY